MQEIHKRVIVSSASAWRSGSMLWWTKVLRPGPAPLTIDPLGRWAIIAAPWIVRPSAASEFSCANGDPLSLTHPWSLKFWWRLDDEYPNWEVRRYSWIPRHWVLPGRGSLRFNSERLRIRV